MSIITAEKLKELREAGVAVPWVNQDCIGCSACVAIAPDVFELNDEWKSEVVELGTYEEGEVNDAISACPVDAIYWEK
jgi:ferredoxin